MTVVETSSSRKSPDAFRTISEVAEDLDVPQHVLRFWESKFAQIKPLKRGGGRRYYRPEDIEVLRRIKTLLYSEGFTIKGAQKLMRRKAPTAESGLALSRMRPNLDALPSAVMMLSEVKNRLSALKKQLNS